MWPLNRYANNTPMIYGRRLPSAPVHNRPDLSWFHNIMFLGPGYRGLETVQIVKRRRGSLDKFP